MFKWVRKRSLGRAAGFTVGLFGLLGQGNLGNDGSMEALLGYFDADHPEVTLDAMCTGPELVKARYGMAAASLRWYQPAEHQGSGVTAHARKYLDLGLGVGIDTYRTAQWVRHHDAVIVPGMGVLESTCPMRPWQTPYSMFVLSASGRLFGTKVAFVSVGANGTPERVTRGLVTTAARLATYRSFRDTVSRDAMGRMGLDTSHDAVYPDVVFSLPVAGAEKAATGAVGIGVMDYCGRNADRYRDHEIRAAYIDKITRFALWLVDSGRTVRLFTSDSVADGHVVQAVVDGLHERRPTLDPAQVIAEPVPSLEDLMRQTALVDVVVATRYHNVLFALLRGKPAISLSYASKSDKLMAELGLSGFTQSVKDLDVGRLIEQFTELERDSARLRPIIAERIAAKAKLVEDQFTELSDTLFHADDGVHPNREHTHGRAGDPATPASIPVVKEIAMSNTTDGERGAAGPDVGNAGGIYKKDFWSKENLKFHAPHYRL